jgi:hypothetical protein
MDVMENLMRGCQSVYPRAQALTYSTEHTDPGAPHNIQYMPVMQATAACLIPTSLSLVVGMEEIPEDESTHLRF